MDVVVAYWGLGEESRVGDRRPGPGPGTGDRGPGAKRRGPGAGGLVLIVDVMASRARGLVACEGRAGDMACLRA